MTSKTRQTSIDVFFLQSDIALEQVISEPVGVVNGDDVIKQCLFFSMLDHGDIYIYITSFNKNFPVFVLSVLQQTNMPER